MQEIITDYFLRFLLIYPFRYGQ